MNIKKSIMKRLYSLHGFVGRKFFNSHVRSESDELLHARYKQDLLCFEEMGGEVVEVYPILSDYEEQAGTASGHYFHQDLLVAAQIFANTPRRHIDVGSRIDGFVAHVAAFREIEVMDVRALKDTGHKNISFLKADLMSNSGGGSAISDSVSCLHALEHFGLGRYGDPIDPHGHIKGFRNILKMVSSGGHLYVSVPIGSSPGVYFNAHRVFDAMEIFEWIPADECLRLVRFDYVDDLGDLHANVDLGKVVPDVAYGCGIYTFKRE